VSGRLESARQILGVAVTLLVVAAVGVSILSGLRLARASARERELARGLDADLHHTAPADGTIAEAQACAQEMLTPDEAAAALAALAERARGAGVALSLAPEPTATDTAAVARAQTYTITAVGEYTALLEAVIRSGLAVDRITVQPGTDGAAGLAMMQARLTLVTADAEFLQGAVQENTP